MKQGSVDTKTVNFNIASAVHVYECITAKHIRRSFPVTGLYPFHRNLAEQFETTRDGTLDKAQAAASKLNNASLSSRLVSASDRHSDNDTYLEVIRIMRSSCCAAFKL